MRMSVPQPSLKQSIMPPELVDRVIKVAAFDPALRNWGMAKVLYNVSSRDMTVTDLKLLSTESEAGKQVKKSSDDLRRAGESFAAAMAYAEWADLLVAEVPSGAQSARAALGNGMSIGLLAALRHYKPLIEVDPISVKKTVTGRKTASKDEMIAWATATYPTAPWLTRKLKGEVVFVDKNEHLADAVAICRTALATNEFRAAVQMLGAMRAH